MNQKNGMCTYLWAAAQILSHLVPVCTDLSNLFDSALLLRWDMRSCQTVSDEKSLDTSMQIDLWGPEGFDRLGYMPLRVVGWGGGHFSNVNRFILSLLCHPSMFLETLIFNTVSLPSVDSHSRPGWCSLSGVFDWSLTYGPRSRH